MVDDLPYVDQEYGDPVLREAVMNIKMLFIFRNFLAQICRSVKTIR